MRLDEEKLEALRSWGEKLRQSSGEEYAAVGRAILMLVDEIDRLHIELWHARMQPSAGEPVAADLHTRLQETLGREESADDAEQPEPERQRVTATSPQAWIAALRRQK